MVRDKRDYKTRCLDRSNGRFIPLEEYNGLKNKILHKCLKCGREWYVSPTNILGGEGCPSCRQSSYTSRSEKEVLDFIKKIYKGKIKSNDRGVIPPQELDIYLPELNLAIEYCGLYWHGDKQKPNNYHLDKTIKCNDLNIRLIHIFEDEWVNKQKIVKEKLRYVLGVSNKPKIYARKCYIKEISSDRKNKFLDKYHIQGRDNSKIKLGLYAKSPKTGKTILVSVMTFCKPRKALGQTSNSIYDYELSRFASTYNYIVIGGFSKLFKYFERNYSWNSLITYADKRWSQGNVYIKNGWYYDHDSKPNYWYVDNNHGDKRFHRYQFRKGNLKKLFPDIYSDSKTEKEIMEEANYYRIYDCGNMVFTYTIDNETN
jgi:predicted  nucleic acid-binding Zn-ribbon protein